MMRANIPKLRRKLMRTRHQDGWVEERGRKVRRWYGHYYVYVKDASGREVRQHRGIMLGEKAKLRKWEAENKLREEIRKVVQNQQPASVDQTFGWFVRERFLPMKMGRWRPSTRATNLGTLEKHILPVLSEIPLAEVDKFKCQVLLNNLAAKGLSSSVVDHCRIMVGAVLEEALDADLIPKNPVRKVENPDTKEPQRPVLSKADASRLIAALPSFRDRLIVMIATFCAMRPGEIFGLERGSFRGDHLFVQGTAWRGTLQPGKAKTKGSKAAVVIPDAIIPLVKAWMEMSPAGAATDLLFPSARPGVPLWPSKWLEHRVRPIARQLGITTKVNFQVLRRSFATNAQQVGSAKDLQTHLRHSKINTTMDVYTQPVDESVRRMVNSFANEVLELQPTVNSNRVQ